MATPSQPYARTPIHINIYDLLPPSHLTTLLWYAGNSLLHSGVVINGKEYAFGGHDRKGVTGVYWSTPQLEPPGGTFRCGLLHGFCTLEEREIQEVVTEASHLFLGPAWNLLLNNCNHFTSYLCTRLTGQPAPRWLNRAASVGMALPCVVPREWISPPEAEDQDGELVNDDDLGDDESENTRLVTTGRRVMRNDNEIYDDANDGYDSDDYDGVEEEEVSSVERGQRRSRRSQDASGWPIPKSERAPMPD